MPVFILDPGLLRRKAPHRHQFLFNGLRALERELRRRGSRLIVRSGDPLGALTALVNETSAGGIFAAEDYSPYARQRDGLIARSLTLELYPGAVAAHPEAILKTNGKPYTVFTPYSRAWSALTLSQIAPVLPAPEKLPAVPDLASQPVPDAIAAGDFPAGEAEAQKRLAHFCQAGIFTYDQDRDRLDTEGTSRLSPYLRFGMLSPRQALQAALQVQIADRNPQSGSEAWIRELIWREFYTAILYHFPEVAHSAFQVSYRNMNWRDDPDALEAWKAGQTGYPIIDAGMRQLAQTGWIPNRVRMLVASFLVKDLLIDWREGERWFMEKLVDGDPAANNGGWQWCAGTGTDAAPYFRIFNPVTQGMRFDPQGSYIRRWVPELVSLSHLQIHSPWKLSPEERGHMVQQYPPPIIEHGFARQRALDFYKANK